MSSSTATTPRFSTAMLRMIKSTASMNADNNKSQEEELKYFEEIISLLDIPMGKLITNFSDSTHKLTLSFNRNN
jgi:hypothetical protein